MSLIKSLSIYTFASFFNKGLVLLLGIIISYYLSEEDFGFLGILNTNVLLGSIFIGVGAKAALAVKYFKVDLKEFNQHFSALLFTPILLFLLSLLLATLFSGSISEFLEIPELWIYYIIILAFSQILNDLYLTLLRVKDFPKKFAFFNIGWGLLNFLLSLVFIIGLGHANWQGRALGIIGSAGLFALIGLYQFYRAGLFTFRFKKEQVRAMLIFGVPLLPHLIGSFAIEYSDIFFINKMVSKEALGIYRWGYQFGMLTQILVASFAMGFGPFLFASLNNLTPELKIKIVRISYLFMFGLLLAVLGITVLSPLMFYYVIDPKFVTAIPYVFWIALAYFFFGGYSLFANYIHYSGKTYFFSFLAILNIGLNLILNYYLILEYGAMGAAYATLISYIVVAVLTAVIATRMYPLPWFNPKVFNLQEIIQSIKWGLKGK